MKSNQSVLTTGEAELLVQFELHPSLERLSKSVGRDITVLSKVFKAISQKADVLTKLNGRWKLSEAGKRMNQITRDYISSQHSILGGRRILRVGTNREFAARIVAPHIQQFQKFFPVQDIALHVYEAGTESALLDGRIEIGFDCGRPQSPEVIFKRIIAEEIFAVAAPDFFKSHRRSFQKNDFSEIPHLLYDRLDPERYIGAVSRASPTAFRSNDIASIRAMCVQGAGWALLPKYAVQDELDSDQLIRCSNVHYAAEKYGVWRLRSRNHLTSEFEAACNWLKAIQL